MAGSGHREGSLEAPTRHPLNWKDSTFHDEDDLFAELERVYDICHGCRRCVSLCNAFPTLFDLVDESDTMEVDGVAKDDYWKVVDHCYLCDLCYLTKCPYVPPHEWNVDFPHLMLRAKAVHFKKHGTSVRNRMLSNTDLVGRIGSIPVISQGINAANNSKPVRKLMQAVGGVHSEATLPRFESNTFRKHFQANDSLQADPGERTRGKVAIFATCYCNVNEPHINDDLVAVLEHNRIPVTMAPKERCCGMPKLELGDLEAVARAKDVNIPQLAKLVDEGWDIVGAVPSCVLMFKQELPLMFPDDEDVRKVQEAIYDPFEYLMLRHREGKLRTDFNQTLGKVAYHVACHQRVQKIGMKTRDVLQLIPKTEVVPVERCSGHDGTYAVKKEFHEISMKIARPVVNRVKEAHADHYTSDCPMAGHQIENGLRDGSKPEHPLSLLRKAYGI
ncbi:MAG TPA: Fe-S oxidoreductase [Gammaproteobacteria bacterium]|nr:Fe-S oxidoreductase [Gammaproteobacteria bacterium]